MATQPTITSSNIPLYTPGDFMVRLNAFIADPNNVENPLVSILNCLPESPYTPAEITNIKSSLLNIQQESLLFESPKFYNVATDFISKFDMLTCLGDDANILFEEYFKAAYQFIEYYNEVKNNQVLKTEVNQNPNYYNN